MQPAHQNLSARPDRCRGSEYCRIRRERVPVETYKRERATKRGSDPASV